MNTNPLIKVCEETTESKLRQLKFMTQTQIWKVVTNKSFLKKKKTFLVTDRQNVLFLSSSLYLRMGPGKLTYTFSAGRLQISAPRQASVGRASRRGSGKRRSADIEQKMYTLIYPYTLRMWMSQDNNIFFAEKNEMASWHFIKVLPSKVPKQQLFLYRL